MASVIWDEQAYSGCFGPGYAVHSGVCRVTPCQLLSLNVYRRDLPAVPATLRNRSTGGSVSRVARFCVLCNVRPWRMLNCLDDIARYCINAPNLRGIVEAKVPAEGIVRGVHCSDCDDGAWSRE